MTYQVAPVQAQDLEAIAELQIRSWQTAYRGLMSHAFLDQTVPSALRQHWAEMPGEGWLLLAARERDDVTGFVAIELGRGEKLAYVDNLHVEPRLKGRGIGRLLMREAARRMIDLRETGVWLTVLDTNEPSRQFYRRIGGEEGPLKHEILVDQPVQSIPVFWRDLSALAAVR